MCTKRSFLVMAMVLFTFIVKAQTNKIEAEGNVGIGTTIPDAKLAVNGRIHAKEVKVDMAGWHDYVLPTLVKTEKYIKEKGYLQGMPSAKEVEAKGLELGEMNKKLLQKVEELTIYLISQNK